MNRICINNLNYSFTQLARQEGKKLYEEKLYEHFNLNVKPHLSNGERFFAFEFQLKHSTYKNSIITIFISNSGSIQRIRETYSYIRFNQQYLYSLLLYLENDFDYSLTETEEINQKFLQLEEEYRIAIYKEKREMILSKINNAFNHIEKHEVMPSNKKISLDCKFRFYNGSYYLSFKIGADKKFIVQSIYDLLRNIEDKKIVTYGKNYSFAHTIDSFDERSKKIINYILSVSNPHEVPKKEIKVTSVNFERFIDICMNSYIYHNYFATSNLIYVSDEKVLPKVKIDDKLKVSFDEVDEFYFGYSRNFIIQKRILKEVKTNDAGYYELARLVSKENIDDFSYVEDVFKSKIYPRFSEVIDINENIKKEYKIKDYSIQSYFDYEDGILKVEPKIYKGTKQVYINDIKNLPYKITRYNTLLSNLGFVDNQITDDGLIYNFVRTDLQDLKDVSEVFLSNSIQNLQVKKYTQSTLNLSYSIGLLNVSLFNSDFSNEELYEILRGIKKKKTFIKLKNNKIVNVEEEDAIKLLNTIETFDLDIKNLSKNQEVPLYQAFKTEYDYLDIIDYASDDSLKNLVNEIVNFKDNEFELSDKFTKVMRSYQIDAYKWMKTLVKHNFCGVLADDMGLGKTLEVISVISETNENKPSLIVCPKSLCYNWKSEFEKWNDKLEVINIIGSTSARSEIINSIDSNSNKIYISSYDSLRNDIDLYEKIKFSFLILDEAQSIKNHNTLKAQSVKKIKSQHRFVLTGTPIENSVMDLWSIFDFLMPQYLGNQKLFRSLYEEAIVSGNANEVVSGLIRKISPFVLRRTKKEVLKDLPEKMETIRIATMEEKQRKIYDANIISFKDACNDNSMSKIEILAFLTRLRQICVNPSLCYDNYDGGSTKFELLYELIDEYTNSGHKIIVFSQFTSALSIISNTLTEKNIDHFMLTGKTEAIERLDMAKQFNDENDKHKVFLVSLKAGGTGLNLVGADIVIHLDPWWNYAVESQATDRAHRIGQKNVVQVIKIICEDSIEQKVIELQRIKKEVAEKIILSDEQNYNSITLTDIKYLLD